MCTSSAGSQWLVEGRMGTIFCLFGGTSTLVGVLSLGVPKCWIGLNLGFGYPYPRKDGFSTESIDRKIVSLADCK